MLEMFTDHDPMRSPEFQFPADSTGAPSGEAKPVEHEELVDE